MKAIFRIVLGVGILLTARAAENPLPAEAVSRANLKRIGAALRAYGAIHENRQPSSLRDLLNEGLVSGPQYFSVGGSAAPLSPADIDTKGDYTMEPPPSAREAIVREKKPTHTPGKVLAGFKDGSIKLVEAPAEVATAILPVVPAVASVAATNVIPPGLPAIASTTNSVVVPPPPTNAFAATTPSGSLADALAQAEKLSAAGRHAEAVPLLERMLTQEPANKLALWQRGVARTWTGDLRGSLADLDALLALDSANQEIRRVRTVTALALGHDLPGARVAAAELLRAQPNNAQVLLVAGQAELTAGNTALAQQHFARATAADPQLVNGVYQQAGQFLQAGVPQMAYLQFIAVVWLSPNFAGGHYGAGLSAARLGFNPQAIQSLERFLLLDPNSAFAATARQEIERLRRAR